MKPQTLVPLEEEVGMDGPSVDSGFDGSPKHLTINPNYGLNKEIKVQLRRGKQGKLEYFSNN